jgi:hypothetical protein
MSTFRIRPRRAVPRPRSVSLPPAVEALEARQLLAIFPVTNNLDNGNNANPIPGSLRQAIVLANNDGNASTVLDEIRFDISPITQPSDTVITPLSPLPPITEAVLIDGYTQLGAAINPLPQQNPDSPETDFAILPIRLDGNLAGPGANGLTIVGSNSIIRGLSITRFAGAGIAIEGAGAVGNTVDGNFIGIAAFNPNLNAHTLPINDVINPSTNPLANGEGVRVSGPNNRVGGTLPPSRNVIQGNRGAGVSLMGAGGTGNLVEGNFLLDNGGDGVLVTTSNNFIGEAVGAGPAGGGNVISGNQQHGVYILGDPVLGNLLTRGNIVVNNEIGTDIGLAGVQPPIRGTLPRPNRLEGVLIQDAPSNLVGGLTDSSRNVIASNGDDGLGIHNLLATGNPVQGNYVGFNLRTNIVYLLPNNQDGLNITTSNNTIGGATTGARNTIANNSNNGITITGVDALGNPFVDAQGNRIAVSGNRVLGNYIGTVGGGDDFGNTLAGILILDAADTVVGGTESGAGNVISGNNQGVLIRNPAASGNVVQGNFIGTNAEGTTDLGNAIDGVQIDNAPRNTIGGTVAEAANVISGNDRGVRLTGAGATTNVVQGNLIGTDSTGALPLGNSHDGVLITAGASANSIGGTAAGAGNVIAFNADNGVLVQSGTDNPILSNPIFSNNLLGIDLGGDGVTPNDPGDIDTGPNNLQNTPVLTSAVTGETSTIVRGTLNGAPNTSFRIEFFTSAQTDRTGFGEGQTPLGSITLTTDAGGDVRDVSGAVGFAVVAPVAPPLGQFITATATRLIDDDGNPSTPAPITGDTSEFSNAVPNAPAILQFSAASYFVDEGAGTVTITVTRTGNTGGRVTVNFATGDGTATAGADYLPTSGTLTFNPGEVNLTFTVPIVQDSVIESNETVLLTLGAPGPAGSALLGTQATATLTIRDDDVSVQFGVADVTVGEGDGLATITVTRSSGVGTATVDFATRDGTATTGADYTPASGRLTFNPGDVTRTITVPILQDELTEPNETILVTLSNASGTAILGTPNTATITIVDDDQPGTIRFAQADYGFSEGQAVATITVVRTGGTRGTVTVPFATADGTAVVGSDYTPVAGVLTFGPGVMAQTFTVPIINDAFVEPDETVNLILGAPTGGATLGSPATATLTILNDDQPATIQFGQIHYVVSEGQRQAVITVTRSGGTGGTVTVPFATTDGTATAGSDYTPVTGVLTFGLGETVQTFTVPIINDPIVEPDETVNLILGAPTGGATLGAPAAATLTIANDDVDQVGPNVVDLRTVASRQRITGIVVAYSEPLDPVHAQDLFNYELVSEGRDGRFGTFDDTRVALRAATYDPATSSVLLTPAVPLRFGTFYRVRVNPNVIPVAGRNVTDVAGNLLDGNNDGVPGGTYLALIGRGVNLKYSDRDGDRIALQLLRGGTLELRRAFNGEADQLRILGAVTGRSELTGHLKVPRTGSDGRTTIPVILGARGVRNRLRTPPFILGRISETAIDALLAAGGLTA